MKTNAKTYFIEVEKALDWNDGYLNFKGQVVENFEEAELYDNEEEAEDAAAEFNIHFGKNGQIFARVR